ncbi:hypothetical protein ATO6_12615 [Oceanicola sp. 22II-s10i]|uniref:SDR family NAD(P)-dependent oxidoreductase n=1 Tax=Oceanicola sp. 22II-s10i TaxID=1317116 RepID=UPI000B526EEE|nr:SDR family oxidoreductase [Oceanicola sp. 22II-s10i]OWU84516.1 hypothetical protein ATO6_12615 [Oceanicola sp. 22II-s10i]
MSWLGLEGRVALVTGASGGIGAAIVRSLVAEGARVALFDRNEAELAALTDEIGDGHFSRPLDLLETDSIVPAIEAAAGALGAPSILVNGAAISIGAPLATVPEKVFTDQMTINMISAFRTAQAFYAVRDTGRTGAIINISSIAATNAMPKSVAYSPAKAALSMLTREQAVEWGPEGIRSNIVSPGLILTPLSEKYYADPADRKAREEVVPTRRIGKPQDIADAVLFLASDKADYVNGAEIVVDGGFTHTLMTHIPRKRD